MWTGKQGRNEPVLRHRERHYMAFAAHLCQPLNGKPARWRVGPTRGAVRNNPSRVSGVSEASARSRHGRIARNSLRLGIWSGSPGSLGDARRNIPEASSRECANSPHTCTTKHHLRPFPAQGAQASVAAGPNSTSSTADGGKTCVHDGRVEITRVRLRAEDSESKAGDRCWMNSSARPP